MGSVEDLARRQDALEQAGLAMASELSLPAVLQKIVTLACRVADARYGALGVLTPKGGEIREFVTYGVTEEERRAIGPLPVGKGILGALIHDAQPLRLRRIQDDPRSVGFPSPNHPPMTSFLGVPIRVRDRVYGNLYLTEKLGAEEFTSDDESALVTLAAQAGIAIENARLYEEAQQQQAWLEAVNEVAQSIPLGHPIDEVLHLITRHARALVEADLATVAAPATASDELVIRAVDGARAAELTGRRFPAEPSISGEALRTRKAILVEDLGTDARAPQPEIQVGGFGPALFVPLGLREKMFGTLAVVNDRGRRAFTVDDLGLLQVFAIQASLALDYTRIQEELQRLAVLEDRERIAKELHDGVVQSLFAVGMSLQAGEALAGDPLRERLASAVEDIDRVIRDLRNYIFGLRPDAPADREVDRALHSLADDFRRGSDIAVRVEVDPNAASRLAGRATDLVQAAREAMANAARHAQAATLSLTLLREDGEAVLEIEDDGRGFDPSSVAEGYGLPNLRDRASALGGRLEIDAAPGEGTRVRLRIPLG